jgi:putative tryptophan/tyrosine transport system substrate-binding protein
MRGRDRLAQGFGNAPSPAALGAATSPRTAGRGEVRRRSFLALLGGAAVAWPAAARTQDGMPLIGFLDRGLPQGMAANLAGFHKGLAENGYTEGKNVTVEYRWAENQIDRLPALATQLVRRPVAVIAATRSSAPALAAEAATTTIPIVFQTGSDPVKDGLVASLNRPGGNITGATRLTMELAPKRLDVLLQLVPHATTIGMLINPNGMQTAAQVQEIQEATQARGLALHIARASSENELDAAFDDIAKSDATALIEGSDPLFIGARKHIVALTISHKIPAIFFERDSVVDGGLLTYSASISDSFRQVGDYVGRILKGAKPADLPVLQPTRFELVINLKTAKALGLTIPPTLLALADEVIE